MPLEGQWERTQTPLRKLTRRERIVALAGLLVTGIAIVAVVLVAGTGASRPGPAPGCIRVVVPGRVGGEVVQGCGNAARAICARASHYNDPRAGEIVAACRDAEIRF